MEKVKDGDTIKTERGVILKIKEKKGILYIKNKKSGTVSLYSRLAVPFEVIKDGE